MKVTNGLIFYCIGKMTISSKGCAEIPREFFNIESGGASCSSVSQPWVNGGSWSCMSETCDDDDDDDDDLPPRIDWREMGAVNDVMNQLDCGTPFLKILINKLK
jgi:hypothetical protein